MSILGSHLNPIISMSCWAFGQLSFSGFLLYSIVQTLASFFGAAVTFIQYFGNHFYAQKSSKNT
jgi:glycerol uptake facilitator-like aquaporin